MVGERQPEELIEKARAYMETVPTITVAELQRQFELGYSSATKLMDELEAAGVVGAFQGTEPRKSLIYTPQSPKLIDRIFKPVMITLAILIGLCVVALIGLRSPRKEYDGPIALTRPPEATENSVLSPSPEPTPDGRFDNLEEIIEQVKALYTPLLQVDHANGIPTGTSLSIAVSTPDLAELYSQCQDKDTTAWDRWEAKEAELVEATAGVADVMAGFGDERTVMVQIVSPDERVIYFTITAKGTTYDAVDTIREQVAQAEAAMAAAEQAKKDREERIANNASSSTSSDTKYILNTSSKVFHRSGCSRADKIDISNYEVTYRSRSSLIDDGYRACGSCNP